MTCKDVCHLGQQQHEEVRSSSACHTNLEHKILFFFFFFCKVIQVDQQQQMPLSDFRAHRKSVTLILSSNDFSQYLFFFLSKPRTIVAFTVTAVLAASSTDFSLSCTIFPWKLRLFLRSCYRVRRRACFGNVKSFFHFLTLF